MSGSACHVGGKMIMLHLYFEEVQCAFPVPTIFLLFIATLNAMLPSQEQSYFISKVFSTERCIIFLVPLRKGMHFQLN